MGVGFSNLLSSVVPLDVWEEKTVGPTLRKLFGAYQNSDNWAVSRKFRQVDDGNGLVSYDELQKVIFLSEHDLLYIFDIFAKQNELVDARELLTMVCIFSSAKIEEKGRYLMALFDATKTGTCTGAEISQCCHTVCAILGKCTGVVKKPKEVMKALKEDLPGLLPVGYAEALKELGKEKAFTEARLISQNELDLLASSLRTAYDELPLSGQPPEDSIPPPPPDWSSATNEPPKTAAGAGAKGAKSLGASKKGGGQFLKSSAKKVSEAELAHLVWMTRLDEDPENIDSLRQLAANATGGFRESSKKPSATRFMILHGQDFEKIAKNLVSFRRSFTKGIAAAIGVPSASVAIDNITKGCVQFSLVGDLSRDGHSLMALVESQLNNASSALRRGQIASFLEGAELLTEEAFFGEGADSGAAPSLAEVQAQLAVAKRRIAELEAVHEQAAEELFKKDEEITRLKEELAAKN